MTNTYKNFDCMSNGYSNNVQGIHGTSNLFLCYWGSHLSVIFLQLMTLAHMIIAHARIE